MYHAFPLIHSSINNSCECKSTIATIIDIMALCRKVTKLISKEVFILIMNRIIFAAFIY